MSRLQELKTIPITYDYFNSLFDLYKLDKTAESFKEQVIPVVNMITQEFVHKYPDSHYNYEELFSECYFKAIYYLNQKDHSNFENSKAFYGWLTKTLRMALFSLFKINTTFSEINTDEEED